MEEAIRSHVFLAGALSTPECLVESIVNTELDLDAIDHGATSFVTITAGWMGGYLEALALHDACVEQAMPV